MKANRKFRNDEAVSPVIAVILMVAITVVLAATVYVWVSGFGANGQQAKSLSLSQVGTLVTTDATAQSAAQCDEAGITWCAKFSVVSVSPNFAGSNLRVTDATTSVGTITCELNGAALGSTALAAGDTLRCYGSSDPASGDKFNFIDKAGNTIVTTLTIA